LRAALSFTVITSGKTSLGLAAIFLFVISSFLTSSFALATSAGEATPLIGVTVAVLLAEGWLF
jgi:hypothetical protein